MAFALVHIGLFSLLWLSLGGACVTGLVGGKVSENAVLLPAVSLVVCPSYEDGRSVLVSAHALEGAHTVYPSIIEGYERDEDVTGSGDDAENCDEGEHFGVPFLVMGFRVGRFGGWGFL